MPQFRSDRTGVPGQPLNLSPAARTQPLPSLAQAKQRAAVQSAQATQASSLSPPTQPLPSLSEPGRTADTPLQVSANSGHAATAIQLFKPQTGSLPGQALQDLQSALNSRLAISAKPVPAALRQQIDQTLDKLAQVLQQPEKPQNQAEQHQLLRNLTQQLQMGNLLDPPVKTALTQLTRAVNRTATPAEASLLNGELQRTQSAPKALTAENLIVMSLRDELLRRQYELIAPKAQETPLFVQHYEEDLGVIRNAVAMADAALSSSRNLSPELLGDLNQLVSTISRAGDGQIAAAVQNLRQQTAAGQLSQFGEQLQSLANQQNLDIPALQNTVAELNHSAAKALGPDAAAQVTQLTDSLNQVLNSGTLSPGTEAAQAFSNQLAQASSQLQRLTGESLGVAKPVNKLADLAFDGVRSGPGNIGGGMAKLIDTYADGMNQFQGKLPPLLFPVTMPIPLVYSDKGNTFLLPAGTRLSQDRRSGAYSLNSPGFYLQNGSTKVLGQQASIQMGSLDRLQMASLAVDTPNTDVLLKGVTAQIDRNARSSLIQAREVKIDESNGQVQLINARLVQTPESFEAASDSLLYTNGDSRITAGSSGLWQSESNGVKSLVTGAQDFNYNDGKTLVSADSLVFAMQSDDNTGASQLRYAGENIAVHSGDSVVKAGSGSFDMLTRPDGSSLLKMASSDVSWQNGNTQVSTQGETALEMQRDASGQIREFSAHGEKLNYRDATQRGELSGGSLKLNYHPDGKLSTISSEVQSLNWQSPERSLSAQGGQLTFNYGTDGVIDTVAGKVDQFRYTGGAQALELDGAQLDASFGEQGSLSALSASSQRIDWRGANGESLTARDSGLSANFYPDGRLNGVNTQLGQVELSQAGQQLKLTQAQAGIQFRPDGTLQQVNGQAQNINWQDANRQLNVANLNGRLDYGTNGLLSQANLSMGQLTYTGAEGQLATKGQTSLNLNYGADGLLTHAKAASDGLTYQGNGGKLDVSGAGLELNYGPGGVLQEMQGGIKALDWQHPEQGNLSARDAQLKLLYGPDGKLSQAGTSIGSLDLSRANDSLKVTDFGANLNYRPDGSLQQADAGIGSLDWRSAAGDNLSAKGLGLQLNYGASGLLSQATAKVGDVNYQGTAGALTTRGDTKLEAIYRDNGQLASIQATSGIIDFTGKDLKAHAENTTLNLQTHDNGLISQISGSTQNLRLDGAWGQLDTQGTTALSLDYGATGLLSGVHASSDKLKLTQGTEALDLTGTRLDLNYNEQGQLRDAVGAIQQGSYSGNFGKVDLAQGGEVRLNYGNNGQLSEIKAGVEQLQYAGDKGNLDMRGTELSARYGADGLLEKIHFGGDSVKFNGQTGQNQPLNFEMGQYGADLTQLNDGGQQFNFTGQTIKLDTPQHKLGLEEVRSLQLSTGADGAIMGMNLHLPGHNTYSNPELNAALDNLQASYTQQGNEIKASFDKLAVNAPKQGLSAEINGASLLDNDQRSHLHIDSAKVVKQLESELKVKVENVDLILEKTATGALASADLQVANAEAAVKGLNLMVRTQNGERVRMHMEMSADGSYLREAFLQVPNGGEIRLQQNDLDVRLGGGQRLSFNQDGQGKYTFRGEGLDINAVTKDASVQIRGGTAQVSLDSQRGDLIIDEIKGTHIQANVAGQKIDVDIKQMEGFLVRATGISGLATGAALHLVPTSDGSTMTAEIRSSYNGMPVSVKFDNVHELKALGTIETNRAHVYIGDPSGRGQVKIEAGPIKMQGSAIEFVARYHTFDPQRMMSSISRALSSDGFEVIKGVQIEADGVLRLQTPNDNGMHAGMTLLFPRPQSFQQQPFMDTNNQWQQGRGMDDGAFGMVTELGWKHKSSDGTQSTYGVHAGAVPGSFISLDQTQGSTTIAGVPLPKHTALPTTGIAGVTYRRHGADSRVDVMAGGYVNPAGFASGAGQTATSPAWVREPSKYGAYAGFNYRKDNWQLGVTSTMDLSKSRPQVGGMVSFGISF